MRIFLSASQLIFKSLFAHCLTSSALCLCLVSVAHAYTHTLCVTLVKCGGLLKDGDVCLSLLRPEEQVSDDTQAYRGTGQTCSTHPFLSYTHTHTEVCHTFIMWANRECLLEMCVICQNLCCIQLLILMTGLIIYNILAFRIELSIKLQPLNIQRSFSFQ